MQMYAYRATERGIRERNIHLYPDERAIRLAAQRAAWEAQQAAKEEARIRREQAEAQRLQMRIELHAMGAPFSKSYQDIEARALKVFKVSKTQFRSDRHTQQIVLAKQFVSYWAVRLTSLSLPQIGRLMGNRHHTTVLHGKRAYPEKRAKMGRYLRPAS